MTTPLVDQPARDAIADDLDSTFVVEAAAGTGKTTEMVHRIMRVLATGRAEVGAIVAVTFTEKAAGELKLRLRQELEVERHATEHDAATRARLERALTNLEEAHVGTIHGFCADLLRERPVEAAVDPMFTVLTETQSRRCYDEAFAAWLHESMQDLPEGVRRSLRRSSRSFAGADPDEDGAIERLRKAGWSLAEWRDFPAAWTRPDYERLSRIETLSRLVADFAATTARAASTRDLLFVDTAPARRAGGELQMLLGAGDYDGAESVLTDLARDRDFRRVRKGSGAAYGKGISRGDVHTAHQLLLTQLDEFRFDADADLAALLRMELQGSIERYESIKAGHGALDFLDLLLRATTLVRTREDVRREFQQRFAAMFVDEFQDTDPLQAELLLLLASDDPTQSDWRKVRPQPGKLFIVGDPKQSIYRFRRADVGIYQSVCRQLQAHGARMVQLTTSFRSVPGIQRVVNAAFAPVMTGDADTLQADYVALSEHRHETPGQPAVVALPVPAPYGRRQISGASIDKSLPDAIAAFVGWLVNDSGWQVTERRDSKAFVPIEARHICILFRRFVNFGTDVTRPYIDALEARGLKHLLVGGRAFHEREEIETLRAALAAVEWPDDELSVFATLRGALFAFPDEELLEYWHRHGRRFDPFRVPDALPAHLAPIGDALRLLRRLHATRNRRPVAETITALLDETRAHVGFALRRAGEQVLANTLHVAELARQYELSGGISFRGFVDELRDAADEGQAAEAPIIEEGSDGVRLMTVHKAKGLEFPVVILADMTAKLAPNEAARHLDPDSGLCALRIGGWSPKELLLQQPLEQAREMQEGIRVAYVAATRARDLLVMPVVGDEPYDAGWVSPINRAVYPPIERRREPSPSPLTQGFKKDSVLERPDQGMAMPATVMPGLHRFDGATPATGYEVVWWDPAVLGPRVDSPFGLRRQELISKDVSLDVVASAERRFIEWRDRRKAAIEHGQLPSLHVRTTSEWAAGAPDGDTAGRDVEVVTLAADSARPSGTRFGTLVHATLAAVPFDATPAAVAAVAATQARLIAAPEDEVAHAAAAVGAALLHPLMAQAREASLRGRCLRETPVTATIGDVLVEGIVDFAFELDGRFVVVDFKTDRAEGELLERYRKQVAFYAGAIERATGKPARAVLMKV